MSPLNTVMDPQSRAGEVRTFHPDILCLLDVFARIERRSQDRLPSTPAGDKHEPPEWRHFASHRWFRSTPNRMMGDTC